MAALPSALPAVLWALLALGWSQAISYTVQVVALSDQQSALNVQRSLLDQAYPAYVVRATTAQGDIYRVRVGSFANRAAALLFAEAMPETAGGPPLPALAEGIPLGVMSLEPRVLIELDDAELEVLPWRDGIALRLQPDPNSPATYRVFRGAETWVFDAWRAQPLAEEVLRLRNMSLWPATWQEDEPTVREEYRVALLDGLAARLGLSPSRLETLQRRPVFGPPFLVVLELVDSAASGGGTILGVAEAGETPSGYGPQRLALGSGELPVVVEPLFRVDGQPAEQREAFDGDGWRATASGEFFLLAVGGDDSAAWKTGVGRPLWSEGNYLLVRASGNLLLYDFVPR
ncbi:MAG: SPOR domain-containing protein [Trueperaceae bacterium]